MSDTIQRKATKDLIHQQFKEQLNHLHQIIVGCPQFEDSQKFDI
jgi:hypothetical protein